MMKKLKTIKCAFQNMILHCPKTRQELGQLVFSVPHFCHPFHFPALKGKIFDQSLPLGNYFIVYILSCLD